MQAVPWGQLYIRNGFRFHVTDNAQQHIAGGIESPVAVVQHLGRDLPDGLGGSQNGHPDGMLVEQGFHKAVENPAVGGV